MLGLGFKVRLYDFMFNVIFIVICMFGLIYLSFIIWGRKWMFLFVEISFCILVLENFKWYFLGDRGCCIFRD